MPRSSRFEYDVDGTPNQVAERLRAQTRFRLFPHQSSPLGRGALGGRVSTGSFAVADDSPMLIASARAVARGTLTDNGDGTTRVAGSIGMPAWVTWVLRIATLLTPLILLGGGVAVWADEPSLAAILLAFLVFAAPVLVLGIGRQVADADAGVDALDERLRGVLTASPVSTDAASRDSERHAENRSGNPAAQAAIMQAASRD